MFSDNMSGLFGGGGGFRIAASFLRSPSPKFAVELAINYASLSIIVLFSIVESKY